MNNAPIGIFDSGVGGLTVARAILDQLPQEELVYIGDTEHGPYGPRSIAEVRSLTLDIMDNLVEHGVKMLVIACNTASAAVLRDARERYDVPVIEVIQPAVRRAVASTRNHRVGVIATEGTVTSRAYEDAFAAAPELDIITQACPRFVEFVENGVTTGEEVIEVAERYLAPVREAGVDTLVLGCTHYPMLAGPISYVMGPDVSLVSSAEETALDVYRQLRGASLLRESSDAPRHVFAQTAEGPGSASFVRLSRRFLGPMLDMTASLPVVTS
ncbi:MULTISPECIES: glutamate racemase [Brachybacterium]|uniref:glutamate racemase n=1 Tax=Brachybacterium TaxID=43668 RepID=UPI000BB76314|nr:MULTISPECIES: glutamate racemase [Brachybacterium]PCC35742.1 glutamate racemase [Brachybacterium alimentarium]RCS64337.1 glutamate racemase [Brachybacterium sp. JB7]RCS67880.1 glutamate racemase [Brachybacterium alimentarium]RCS80886.1 glutamate racemase [Brachybacterium alimentarium]RCS84050.1 glutamate racemase [Brachybacterium alimentarium]